MTHFYRLGRCLEFSVAGFIVCHVLCPNCMSPYIEPLPPADEDSDKNEGIEKEVEPLFHCTECEYVAPNSEFIPVDFR